MNTLYKMKDYQRKATEFDQYEFDTSCELNKGLRIITSVCCLARTETFVNFRQFHSVGFEKHWWLQIKFQRMLNSLSGKIKTLPCMLLKKLQEKNASKVTDDIFISSGFRSPKAVIRGYLIHKCASSRCCVRSSSATQCWHTQSRTRTITYTLWWNADADPADSPPRFEFPVGRRVLPYISSMSICHREA